MNLETQAAMYFHLTNYTKWNILGALQFLSETIDFASESMNDVAETFRRQLETLSKDSNILSSAKNKVMKMCVNLEETLTKRLDIKGFFESQDLKYAQRSYKNNVNLSVVTDKTAVVGKSSVEFLKGSAEAPVTAAKRTPATLRLNLVSTRQGKAPVVKKATGATRTFKNANGMKVLEQLSAQSIESLTSHLGSEGASGLLRRLNASEHRTSNPVTLSELLEGEIHSNTVVSNITNDLTSLSGEDGEIQWVFRAIEDCLTVIRSGFLLTELTERDVDVHLIRPFFNILWEEIHLHYGEGESRVSRFRRAEGKMTAKSVDDRFDWLFSNYQLFPDNVRGLELGIAQNTGPTHLEAADKSRTDLVKAVKTARDQLNHIIRTIQNDYGSADLSEQLRSGIAALSMVAVHVVGFRIMVNIVFHVGSNVFAIAEIGSAFLPHSIESIHDALSMCRLTLKIKSLITRSKKLVQALRAEAQRTRVNFSGIAKDQLSVTEMSTPKKVRK